VPPPPDCLIGIDALRGHQLKGVRVACAEQRGLLWHSTGAGKTESMAAIAIGALDAGLPILVVVSTGYLLHDTAKRLAMRLGDDVRVTKVGDGSKDATGEIVVGTYQTLKNHAGKRDAVGSFVARCGAVFVDEAHHAASPSYEKILKACVSAGVRIGFTGTVDKSDRRKSVHHEDNATSKLHRFMLERYLGGVLHRVTNDYMIRKGYSARPRILVVNERSCFGPMVPTPPPPKDLDGRAIPGSGAEVYKQVFERAVIRDKRYRATVARIARACLRNGKPPFVFSHRVDHILRLGRTFETKGIPYRILYGDDPVSRRQEVVERFADDGDFVLLTSSIFVEGADIPEIRAVVLAAARRSPIELLQRIGRGIRAKDGDNTVDVYDFDPVHAPMLHDQFLARAAVYEDEGFSVRDAGDMVSLLTG